MKRNRTNPNDRSINQRLRVRTRVWCAAVCAVLTAVTLVAVPSSSTAATLPTPTRSSDPGIGSPIIGSSGASTTLTWSDAADGIKAEGVRTPASLYGLTVGPSGSFSVPVNESVRMVGELAVLYRLAQPIGAIVKGDDTPAALTPAGTLTASLSHQTAGGDGVASPQFDCHCKGNWGIVSGTLYFNMQGTYDMAYETWFVEDLTVFLPPPWDSVFTYAALYYQTRAGQAYSAGKCIDIKSYGKANSYLYPGTSEIPHYWCLSTS